MEALIVKMMLIVPMFGFGFDFNYGGSSYHKPVPKEWNYYLIPGPDKYKVASGAYYQVATY